MLSMRRANSACSHNSPASTRCTAEEHPSGAAGTAGAFNGSKNVHPSAAQPEYFDAFATAWHSNNRAPQSGRRKMTGLRWWRTRSDPFAESWSLVESWLMTEPNITAQELMARLTTQLPDLYPTRAQLRTLQRRVKAWRAQWARQLVFATTSSHQADRELALIETEAISNRRGE